MRPSLFSVAKHFCGPTISFWFLYWEENNQISSDFDHIFLNITMNLFKFSGKTTNINCQNFHFYTFQNTQSRSSYGDVF